MKVAKDLEKDKEEIKKIKLIETKKMLSREGRDLVNLIAIVHDEIKEI